MAERKKGGRRGNGEGSIYQRKDGKWVFAISVKDPAGAAKRLACVFDTYAEALAKSISLNKAKQDNSPLGVAKMSVGRYLDDWLEYVARPRVAPTTHTSYEVLIRLHIKPALGQVKLVDLGPEHLRHLMAAKVKAGTSPRRVEMMRNLLRGALNDAIKDRKLIHNAALMTSPPKQAKKSIEPFDAEETRQVLEALRGRAHEVLFTLMLSLGTRRGESVAIPWGSVDLREGTVEIKQQLQRLTAAEVSYALENPYAVSGWLKAWVTDRDAICETKTGKSHRTLPLLPKLVEMMERHRGIQRLWQERAGNDWKNDHDLVFTNEDGSCLNGRQVSQAWKRILESSELSPKRLHDARHGTASLMLEAGVDIATISKFLGHSTIKLTADTYVHSSAGGFADAAGKLGALLAKRKS